MTYQYLDQIKHRVLSLVICSWSLMSCSSDSSPTVATPNGPVPVVDWVAPTLREDGTPLSLSEIASFNVYYGTETGVYINTSEITDPSDTEFAFKDFSVGTYYSVVTTVDTDGRESVYSVEVKTEVK